MVPLTKFALLGKIVPIKHALVHWMIEYAALLMAVRYAGTIRLHSWRAKRFWFRVKSAL